MDTELVWRQAMAKYLKRDDVLDVTRAVTVTPFNVSQDTPGGWILTLEGSPPPIVQVVFGPLEEGAFSSLVITNVQMPLPARGPRNLQQLPGFSRDEDQSRSQHTNLWRATLALVGAPQV